MSEPLLATLILQWIAIVVLGFLLAGTLRQLGLLQLRLGADPGALITQAGIERGSLAPEISATDLNGINVRLSDLPDRARVLLFLSTSCQSCHELVPHMNEIVATRGSEFDFLAICRGSEGACRKFAQETALGIRTLVDPDGDIEAVYEVPVTPFVFLLDHQGTVLLRGIANNWIQMESLLDQEGVLEPAGAVTQPRGKATVESLGVGHGHK